MAYAIQQAVIDFHTKYGHPVRDYPQTITEGEAVQAFGFIEEEFNELADALFVSECGDGDCCKTGYDPSLVQIADALGDIVVTAYGKAIRHGIDLDAVLREIMRANMTKTGNGQGKIQKGPDYVGPDIARVIFE